MKANIPESNKNSEYHNHCQEAPFPIYPLHSDLLSFATKQTGLTAGLFLFRSGIDQEFEDGMRGLDKGDRQRRDG